MMFSICSVKIRHNQKRVDRQKTWQLEFEDNVKGKEYKVKAICNNTVYVKKSESGQLLGLYYLISQKSFSDEKHTWELALAIQHLWRLISTSHKDNLNKPTAISSPINTALLIARPIIKPRAQNNKQKRNQPVNASSIGKHSKKN